MRIVGEILHASMKITIMHHNEKYTIQFEDGDMTQSVIVRESNFISSVNDIRNLVDKTFVDHIYASMQSTRTVWQKRLLTNVRDDDFETII